MKAYIDRRSNVSLEKNQKTKNKHDQNAILRVIRPAAANDRHCRLPTTDTAGEVRVQRPSNFQHYETCGSFFSHRSVKTMTVTFGQFFNISLR